MKTYKLTDIQVENIFRCIEATWKGRNIASEMEADEIKALRITLAQQVMAHRQAAQKKKDK